MKTFKPITIMYALAAACGSNCGDSADGGRNGNNNFVPCTPAPAGHCEAPSGSACYYIDPVAGDDGGLGTYDAPWRTLVNVNRSIYAQYRPENWVELQPGDVVYVMGGVHTQIYHPGDDGGPDGGGSYIFYIRGVHGEEGRPVTLKGFPGHRPVFDPGGQGRAAQVSQSSHIHVEGIEVRNAYSRGICLSESDRVTVRRVRVYDTDGSASDNIAGLEVLSSTNVDIAESVFFDNYDRTAAAAGQQTHNSGNLVLFGGADIAIHDCIFYMTGNPAGEYSGFGVKYKHASRDPAGRFELHHNYFENLKYFAIGVGTANAHVHHNIVNGAPCAVADQDHGGVTHQSNQIFEYNTFYNARGFYLSPTLDWIDHENGPWPELTDIYFRQNIVYDTTESFTSDRRTVMLNAYMSDELYLALRDGIAFEHNCYFNPNLAVSFGFAEAENYGPLGGHYDLAGWQSEYGYDADSVEADPTLEDPLNLDFTPAASGPCAGLGALADGQSPPMDKDMVFRCD